MGAYIWLYTCVHEYVYVCMCHDVCGTHARLFHIKNTKQNKYGINRHTHIQTHYGNELDSSTLKFISFYQTS